VDAGSSSKKGTGNYQIVPYLKYSGTDRIEAIFISHWDEDHVSGLEDIFAWAAFEQVEVCRMILPDIAFKDEAHKKLLDLAQKYQIPTGVMKAGEIWEEGELSFSCLHPYKGERVTDRNAASMVLRLQYENFGALFPGDLEKEQEQWLLEAYNKELLQTGEECVENKKSSGMLSATLFMAAHHGSSTSNSEAFLKAVGPKAVFISCGRNNIYGHPHQEVLKRLEALKISWYGTYQRGAVWAEIQKGKMTIESFL